MRQNISYDFACETNDLYAITTLSRRESDARLLEKLVFVVELGYANAAKIIARHLRRRRVDFNHLVDKIFCIAKNICINSYYYLKISRDVEVGCRDGSMMLFYCVYPAVIMNEWIDHLTVTYDNICYIMLTAPGIFRKVYRRIDMISLMYRSNNYVIQDIANHPDGRVAIRESMKNHEGEDLTILYQWVRHYPNDLLDDILNISHDDMLLVSVRSYEQARIFVKKYMSVCTNPDINLVKYFISNILRQSVSCIRYTPIVSEVISLKEQIDLHISVANTINVADINYIAKHGLIDKIRSISSSYMWIEEIIPLETLRNVERVISNIGQLSGIESDVYLYVLICNRFLDGRIDEEKMLTDYQYLDAAIQLRKRDFTCHRYIDLCVRRGFWHKSLIEREYRPYLVKTIIFQTPPKFIGDVVILVST